jgi:hypothetical protein
MSSTRRSSAAVGNKVRIYLCLSVVTLSTFKQNINNTSLVVVFWIATPGVVGDYRSFRGNFSNHFIPWRLDIKLLLANHLPDYTVSQLKNLQSKISPLEKSNTYFNKSFHIFKITFHCTLWYCSIPSCYCVPLMQPSRLKFIKIKLLCWQSHYNYIFKIILNLKSKFRGPLSQATASKHSNAFTFTLLLSEGRAGEAWEPSYKMMLFPFPTIKCLSLLPGLFTFIYSSTFYLSLSLFCVSPYRC